MQWELRLYSLVVVVVGGVESVYKKNAFVYTSKQQDDESCAQAKKCYIGTTFERSSPVDSTFKM